MLEVHRLVGPPPGAPSGSLGLYVPEAAPGVRVGRRSFVLPAGSRLSLDTFVNGLPVAYWGACTDVRQLLLRAVAGGRGLVRVLARSAAGEVRLRAEHVVDDAAASWTLPVELAADDVWWWVELEAGPDELRLDDAAWWAELDVDVRVGVAITTHDRPADCVAALAALSETTDVARIVVVDQGRARVTDHPDAPGVLERLGERVTVVEQPNLGGSGGYARGMHELLQDARISHVVLLDDDVVVEPEAVRRLAAFGAAAGEVVVGGQMLELTRPTVLHSTGEVVDRRWFWWGPAPGAASAVELSGSPLSALAAVTRVTPVDFNGWWMCALPATTLRRLGLPLPLFIKWDDVEYGLRAARAGVPTVTLPGAGVWHMPWSGKDASRDWQAFFLTRNRLVVAALHSESTPWGLLAHLGAHALSHLVTMAYSAADLVAHGVEEFGRGPQALVPSMQGGPGALLPRRQAYADGAPEPRPDVLTSAPAPLVPRGRVAVLARAVRGMSHALVGQPAAPEPPRRALTLAQARWPVLSRLDNVWVGDAGGGTGTIRRRDQRVARRLLRRLLVSLLLTALRWRSLSRAYREAAPTLVTPQAWGPVFTASGSA